ncbi:MAG TPA: GH1 family beta-glucosidase [Actinomycetota bacterium]|nr:GH1 family beta-glucosidase [Actinomycetota bacterium]
MSSPAGAGPSFPEGFLWGAATSAYQVEGAVHEDGRGESIWDTFCRIPGAVRDGDTGDVACDQYHRYEEDATLMADLGIGAYRFSVAWPRIQPHGRGPANQRGLDHYRRLVDALLVRGITPVPTLYHWDLPQALEDIGGWPARETADCFAEYAAIVAEALGDSVPMWITINEPMVAAWLGYASGVHAPGRHDERAALSATHHLLLAHGRAVDAIRSTTSARVGIALNLYPCRPASSSSEDERAAERADEQLNRLYLDPIFGRGYPPVPLEGADLGFLHEGDLVEIARPIDLLGVNYYSAHTIVGREPPTPRPSELPASLDAWSVTPPDAAVTSLGWPIHSDGLTEMLVRVHREYGPPSVFVTENGAAFDDRPESDGSIHDADRVAYLGAHVEAMRDALAAGVPLGGYLVWSLLDNFEWAEGYEPRFGIVRVDFETQARIPKDSARWFRDVISTNGGRWGP